jgi:alpha-L-fucosidase 2
VKPTRREILRGGLALAAIALTAQAALAADPASPFTFWHASEAKRWLKTLPVGNGRIGGMFFGGITKEQNQSFAAMISSARGGNCNVHYGKTF